MTDNEYLDSEEREAAIHALLAAHPDAPVAAIDEALFVPMPASVPLLGHRYVAAATPLELVPADEVNKMLAVWVEARTRGMAKVLIHLAEAPDQLYVMHLIDVRERYGVFLGIGVPAADPSEVVEAPMPEELASNAPRVARMRKNVQAVITEVDDAVTTMLGWSRDEIIGTRTVDFVHPDDVTPVVEAWLELIAKRHERHAIRLRHRRKDGTYAWLDVSNRLAGDDTIETDMVDVTGEMAALHAAWERQQIIDELAHALPMGIAQIDRHGRIVYTNARLHDIFGIGDSSLADHVADHLAGLFGSDWTRVQDAVRLVLDEGGEQHLDVIVQPADSDERHCEITMRPLHDENGAITGAVVAVNDTTQRARMLVELEDRATFDSLTGCHNRASVIGALEMQLGATRTSEGTGVIFVDLDTFRAVNDRFGHAIGDELLSAVAGRMRVAVRNDDLIGRFGGDEFLVVIPSIERPDEAMRIATRVAELLHGTIELTCGPVEVRASVGVSWTNKHRDVAGFVAEADAAMYESKRQGAGRPVLYGPTLDRSAARGVDEERALRDAMRNGDLAVHYQPIVRLADGAVVGYEALLRWQHGAELVVAGDFIEVAEKSGLIHEIGAWVIDVVCRQASELLGTAADAEFWTINASPLQIAAAGLTDTMREALARYQLPAGKLIIEVTEHEALGRSTTAHATLTELAAMGIGLALDDFGTGWSSLELLMRLSVDCIKIPREFTMMAIGSQRARTLTSFVISAARELQASIVVEGIETPAERQLMLELGAELGQGWLFAKALPASELFAAVLPR